MRLRKVSGASGLIEQSSYIIVEPLKYKGKYKDLFANDNPLHLEIGCGKGNFLIAMALTFPKINFIGIEKYDSVLLRAIEKLRDLTIPNLYFINCDASLIDIFFTKEISLIYLNFSDPWSKKRHAKRRLTNELFLNKYNLIFKDNPSIVMKTDNRKFFEYSLRTFIDNQYKIKDISLDLHKDGYLVIQTEYEEKFRDYPIYMVYVTKK